MRSPNGDGMTAAKEMAEYGDNRYRDMLLSGAYKADPAKPRRYYAPKRPSARGGV